MSDNDRVKFLIGQPLYLSNYQKFRLLLKLLRKDFPTKYPVKVRRVSKKVMGDDAPFGICWLVNEYKERDKRYFQILISNKYDIGIQLDTLIHEWAHAKTWFDVKDNKFHSKPWTDMYGRLYRKYIED